jgi:peptidoglycan/LPS O-acetylase OafA/YrhL
MNFNQWVRQIHRWLAIVFTLTVIANLVAMSQGTPPMWIVYSPLPPLFLMLATGLYMFALPYMAKRRKAQEKVQ